MSDYSGLSAEALAEWDRTRYNDQEMEEKQAQIVERGLHCKVCMQLLHGSLWAIVIHPSEGFTYLMNEAGRMEMRLRKDVLHISICFRSDIKKTWQYTLLYQLLSKYRFPRDHIFRVDGFGNGVSANISPEDSVYKDISSLHNAGTYWRRNIHISM